MLTPLTGKKDWSWESTQKEVFREIIKRMYREPILWTIKDQGQMKVEVDGSGYTMGTALMQMQAGKWRTTVFMSETYNAAERNYHTKDRELLAIMKML